MLKPYKFNGVIILIDRDQQIDIVWGPYDNITSVKCFNWDTDSLIYSFGRTQASPPYWVLRPQVIGDEADWKANRVSWLEVLLVTGMSKQQCECILEQMWVKFVDTNNRNKSAMQAYSY